MKLLMAEYVPFILGTKFLVGGKHIYFIAAKFQWFVSSFRKEYKVSESMPGAFGILKYIVPGR